MKRIMMVTAVASLLLAMSAGIALAANIACPNASFGVCVGTPNDDTMGGGPIKDIMTGRQGADTMSGRLNADEMVGDLGNDFLDGGAGNDVLKGGDGQDVLNGRLGNDDIFAERDQDSDSITCGPGEADFARVTPIDVIDNRQAGSAPESVLEAGTTCEEIDVVILDNGDPA